VATLTEKTVRKISIHDLDPKALVNHAQWSSVESVCRTLQSAGFQALLAGGCVRDLLMGRIPNDFDVATDATPDQVHAIYPHALTVGKAFGVTILPFTGFQIEVATFRQDLDYKDGRRPEGVRFVGPEEDAKRRDFTVNALFFDPESQEVIDYVGGIADIQARRISAVGDPEMRFAEDRLRLLRAVRFAAQLDFTIAKETLDAVSLHAPEVGVVSRERVRDELSKLLKVPHRRVGFELMAKTGLIKALFPDLHAKLLPNTPIFDHWLRRLELLKNEYLTAGLVLFFLPLTVLGREASDVHWYESHFKNHFLKPLKLENKLIDAVMFALRHYQDFLSPESLRRGELILLLAHPAAEATLEVARIIEADSTVPGGSAAQSKRANRDQDLRLLIAQALGQNRQKPAPLLTGEDAKLAGLQPGAEMGKMLHEAYLQQLEGSFKSREAALEWLRDQLK
jgi:tRNA nucleotidyltransferase/poly(A) polymerase